VALATGVRALKVQMYVLHSKQHATVQIEMKALVMLLGGTLDATDALRWWDRCTMACTAFVETPAFHLRHKNK
jgi:hypothetical protein